MKKALLVASLIALTFAACSKKEEIVTAPATQTPATPVNVTVTAPEAPAAPQVNVTVTPPPAAATAPATTTIVVPAPNTTTVITPEATPASAPSATLDKTSARDAQPSVSMALASPAM